MLLAARGAMEAPLEWLVRQLPRCAACGRHFAPQQPGDYACLPCRGVTFGEPLTREQRAIADRLLRQVFG
jgi:hypothetical protein